MMKEMVGLGLAAVWFVHVVAGEEWPSGVEMWPEWSAEAVPRYREALGLDPAQGATQPRESELRSAFVRQCVLTFPEKVSWWRWGQGAAEDAKTRAFDAAACAYNALRDDPLRWDPDEFWRRRRCALMAAQARRGGTSVRDWLGERVGVPRGRWRAGCDDDDDEALLDNASDLASRPLRHPIAIGVLRVLFASRREALARRRHVADADGRYRGRTRGLDTQWVTPKKKRPHTWREVLPAWLARRVAAAAEKLEKSHHASPAAAVYCAAAAEVLGSKRRWPPRWLPKSAARALSSLRRIWGVEVAAYVLWAELLNSTALLVYFVFGVSAVLRLLAPRIAPIRRALSAADAAVDALGRHEVRVALFALLATASWLALGDALELVRRAQQCAFAAFALRWFSDAYAAFRDSRRRLSRLTRLFFARALASLRRLSDFGTTPAAVENHRRRLVLVRPLDAARVVVDDDDDEDDDDDDVPRPPPPREPAQRERAAEPEEEDWREDVAVLARVAAELAAPAAAGALALALGACCVVPVLWAAGLVADPADPSPENRWDQLVELLVADDAPSPASVFTMNALLVATTVAPLISDETRANAHAAVSKLAVQLHRRLLASPVPPRLPDSDDDLCAICLLTLHPQTATKPLVFCRYGCGKALHADCMRVWLQQKNQCIFCGTLWTDD